MTTEIEQLPPQRRTPLTDDFPTGPAVGERVPDFALSDQSGNIVRFPDVAGGGRTVLFFHRSASWCPYCRTHLSSFQKHIGAFEAAGIGVFAISNDPVETLAQFASENAITYPLLSDADSAVIRRFGILNTLIRPDEDRYGIAYPGVYVIGSDGLVEEKLFYREYAVRPSVGGILKSILGDDFSIQDNPMADFEGPGVRLSVALAEPVLAFMQQTPLYVRMELDEGLHVYGEAVPDGFVGVRIDVTAPEGVRVLPTETPTTRPFRVDGIAEEFQVYDGTIEFRVPLISELRDLESIRIGMTVQYQACDEQQCYLPRSETIELDVPLAGLNRPRPRV